ncbi:hypothetical protein HK102_009357 [Quaeritorhiza haematococci]|nr:hypothetical protein HK102_009357 [Quaeritorhiza haematococci]
MEKIEGSMKEVVNQVLIAWSATTTALEKGECLFCQIQPPRFRVLPSLVALLAFVVLRDLILWSFRSTAFFQKMPRKTQLLWVNTGKCLPGFPLTLTPTSFTLVAGPHEVSTWSSTILQDLISTPCPLCEITLALSNGYFAADLVDFVRSRLFFNTPSIWVHHFVILGTFTPSLYTSIFAPYLTATLVIEINGVFFHLHKLLTLPSSSKSNSSSFDSSSPTSSPKRTASSFLLNAFIVPVNAVLLIVTFLGVRLPVHIYLLRRVIQERDVFPVPWMWYLALFGMATVNLLNVWLGVGVARVLSREMRKSKKKEKAAKKQKSSKGVEEEIEKEQDKDIASNLLRKRQVATNGKDVNGDS